MKPYGREKNIKGFNGKIDWHPNSKGNWWEDEINNILPRTTVKHKLLKEILYDLYNDECFIEDSCEFETTGHCCCLECEIIEEYFLEKWLKENK